MKKLPGLKIGKTYSLLVEVRGNRLKAYVDGVVVSQWSPDMGELSMWQGWKLRKDNLLGIGSAGCSALFHNLEIVKVRGKGTPTRAPR